jgi:hypothetical protein
MSLFNSGTAAEKFMNVAGISTKIFNPANWVEFSFSWFLCKDTLNFDDCKWLSKETVFDSVALKLISFSSEFLFFEW